MYMPTPSKKNINYALSFKTLSFFWEKAKNYPYLLFLVFFFFALALIADAAWGYSGKWIVDGMIANDWGLVLKGFYLLVFLYVFAVLFFRAGEAVLARFESYVMRDLSDMCFQHIHSQEPQFFSDNFSGAITKRVSRFASSFEMIADKTMGDIYAMVITGLSAIVLLTIEIPIIGLVVLLWSFVFLLVIIFLNKKFLPSKLEAAEKDTQVTAQLADTITNAETIQSFATQERERGFFWSLIDDWKERLYDSWIFNNYLRTAQSVMMFIMHIGVIIIFLFLWRAGEVTPGDFIFMEALLLLYKERLWSLGLVLKQLFQAFADADEMTEMLLKNPKIMDKKGAKDCQIKDGRIVFADVKFSYDGVTSHSDFSLDISPRESVALVGPSGSGKTTFVKLLHRFFDSQQGDIAIDGIPIKDFTIESLRSQISLVSQDPLLFHRTIFENIAYANPSASRKEVLECSKKAFCHGFISQMPNGYETLVGERGVKLSGGQRQRLALARAFLANSPILVLDEATSSLDSESESFIQDALEEIKKGSTTIVIAHRLSTIAHCDRIVVFEGGKIQESGSHEELLSSNGSLYKKLYTLQKDGYF